MLELRYGQSINLFHINLGFYLHVKLSGNKTVILPNAADTCNREFEVQCDDFSRTAFLRYYFRVIMLYTGLPLKRVLLNLAILIKMEQFIKYESHCVI